MIKIALRGRRGSLYGLPRRLSLDSGTLELTLPCGGLNAELSLGPEQIGRVSPYRGSLVRAARANREAGISSEELPEVGRRYELLKIEPGAGNSRPRQVIVTRIFGDGLIVCQMPDSNDALATRLGSFSWRRL